MAEGIGAVPGDGELTVQGEQLKVILGDLGNERNGDVPLRLLAGDILRTGGFIEPAEVAPQINFPRGIEITAEHGSAGAGG